MLRATRISMATSRWAGLRQGLRELRKHKDLLIHREGLGIQLYMYMHAHALDCKTRHIIFRIHLTNTWLSIPRSEAVWGYGVLWGTTCTCHTPWPFAQSARHPTCTLSTLWLNWMNEKPVSQTSVECTGRKDFYHKGGTQTAISTLWNYFFFLTAWTACWW